MEPKLYAALAPKIDRLSKIPAVDYGGCGFVALHMYDYLISKGYKPRILGLERSPEEREELSLNIRSGIGSSATHFVVKVGSAVIDARSVKHYRELREEYQPGVVVSRELLAEALKERWRWCLWFDRKYVPVIRRILKCEN